MLIVVPSALHGPTDQRSAVLAGHALDQDAQARPSSA